MAHKALRKVDHRPWPIPESAWRMKQRWQNLLFAHWPVPRIMVQPLVPDALTIQEFNGSAWIGFIPFQMKNVALRPLPSLPGISSFPELNLRLYVEYRGKPGVWFLSLDATNSLAVWVARNIFNLPYHMADITVNTDSGPIQYYSKRESKETPVEFQVEYTPISKPYQANEGTLEKWLTERYCLYAQYADDTLYRTEIHHLPWRLQKAEADIPVNELHDPFNIELPDANPLLHFAKNMNVIFWPPKKLG